MKPFIAEAPVPSPGKYVVTKKFDITDSPCSLISFPRPTLLSTSGRCFTIDKLTKTDKPIRTLQRNQTVLTPGTKSLSNEKLKTRKLLKAYSRKTNPPLSMYDEGFIRYVNELDSYFKQSELRHQSSLDVVDSLPDNEQMTLTSASFENPTNRLSLRRKKFLWNQTTSKSTAIPQISLNSFDVSSTDLDMLEVSMKTSSDNASHYATPDQEVSFITAPDTQSLCVTPDAATMSDLSCYLTADQNSSLETDTFIYEIAHESRHDSQETLFNESFDYDFQSSIDSFESEEFGEESCAAKLSRISLNVDDLDEARLLYDTDSDHSSDDLDGEAEDVLCDLNDKIAKPYSISETIDNQTKAVLNSTTTAAAISIGKLKAKERRSNFVRTTCIDLDDETSKNNDSQEVASVAAAAAAIVVLDEQEPKKESYLKCCPA